MSANNYYVIRQCICSQSQDNRPFDLFVATMEFASDDEEGSFTESECARSYHFPDPTSAYKWASDQKTEYGVTFDPNKYELTLTRKV